MRLRARPFTLLSAATAVGVGPVFSGIPAPATFSVYLYGLNGNVAATVLLYGSNDPDCSINQSNAASTLLATFTLSGTGAGLSKVVASDVWPVNIPYAYFWVQVMEISGNSAAVSCTAGY